MIFTGLFNSSERKSRDVYKCIKIPSEFQASLALDQHFFEVWKNSYYAEVDEFKLTKKKNIFGVICINVSTIHRTLIFVIIGV